MVNKQIHQRITGQRKAFSAWCASLLIGVMLLASAPAASADTGCNESPATFTIDNRDGRGLRITALTATYEGVFVAGVSASNTVIATVDWAGKQPLHVVFSLQGVSSEIGTATDSAEIAYDMGVDLVYSPSGALNELTATAVATDGARSAPARMHLWGLELPEWATSLETMLDLDFDDDLTTRRLVFSGDVELLSGGIDGIVHVPERIPEIGGTWGVTLDPIHFSWELSAWPSSSGSGLRGAFDIQGDWGGAACAGGDRKDPLAAAFQGSGDFFPDVRLASVGAELSASMTFELPKVPLLCQWTGCCTGSCPYFQASISPGVSGAVYMEQGQPDLIAGLKFKEGELGLEATVKGTVGIGDEGTAVSARGTIGGRPYVTLQFPADDMNSCPLSAYVKEAGVDLLAKLTAELWRWDRTWDWEFNIYHCPDSGFYMSAATPIDGSNGEVRIVERAYLRAPEGYCVFPRIGQVADALVGGLPEPILNVGTVPAPSVASTADAGLLLFVFDDAKKPTGQHQEIYFARWDGNQWTTHAPLTDNIQPDTQPVPAIDSSANEIAVWVRAAQPDGSEVGPRDVIGGTEIVFSSFDSVSGTWAAATPLTSNSYADMQPWFESTSAGEPRVLWLSSPTNAIPVWHDEEIAPLVDVLAADWTGTAFGNPYPIATGLQTATPPDVLESKTHQFLAYVWDGDSNAATSEDREIMVRQRRVGEAWGADAQLTTDLLSDTAPQLAADESGTPILVWVKRMVPQKQPGDGAATQDELWFSSWDGAGWAVPSIALKADGITEPVLMRNAAGRVILFWVAASQAFSDLYYSVYDSASGEWGPPQKLTDDVGAETMISIAESGGNLLAAYVKRRIDLSDPSGLPHIGLSDIHLLEHVPIKDLAISNDGFSFDPVVPVRGEQVEVCVDVALVGDFSATDIAVEFFDGDPASGGESIGNVIVAALLPGQSLPACTSWTVPDDATPHRVYAVVDGPNVIPESDDITNNKASVQVFRPDLRISSPAVVAYTGSATIIIGCTVVNEGGGAAEATTLQVRNLTDGSSVIQDANVPTLNPSDASSVQFVWDVTTVEPGMYVLEFVADSEEALEEASETNNVRSLEVAVLGDLQLEQWSARHAAIGVEVVVKNVGAKPTAVTAVHVLAGDELIRGVEIPVIDPGGSITVFVPALAADTLLDVVVNPGSDGSDEVSLLNNSVQAEAHTLPECLTGPPTVTPKLTPSDECVAAVDEDGDGDIDLLDVAMWLRKAGMADVVAP